MDKQEEFMIPNRAEYIKLARESCSRNQSGNLNGKVHTAYKNKEKLMREEFYPAGVDVPTDRPGQTVNMKLFLVRLICACLLFLTVILMDQFDFSIKEVNVKQIEELVSDNVGVEEAQNFFVTFLDKLRQ
ncbi:hypothetical protein [Clostridium sp. KNHs205]|jgi:hypothetical protein|uniref:hypothetical protein n=1 Tax=Clostridium sp. KNHs205 TaxID=1449050 RepID=UPI00051C4CA3|nr:hypothetical protein [Clostridium sp. KNHs205]